MDSLIEELFVAVKRAEKEATRGSTESPVNDAAEKPSVSDSELRHPISERRH